MVIVVWSQNRDDHPIVSEWGLSPFSVSGTGQRILVIALGSSRSGTQRAPAANRVDSLDQVGVSVTWRRRLRVIEPSLPERRLDTLAQCGRGQLGDRRPEDQGSVPGINL